jgi:hypothetical protein
LLIFALRIRIKRKQRRREREFPASACRNLLDVHQAVKVCPRPEELYFGFLCFGGNPSALLACALRADLPRRFSNSLFFFFLQLFARGRSSSEWCTLCLFLPLINPSFAASVLPPTPTFPRPAFWVSAPFLGPRIQTGFATEIHRQGIPLFVRVEKEAQKRVPYNSKSDTSTTVSFLHLLRAGLPAPRLRQAGAHQSQFCYSSLARV